MLKIGHEVVRPAKQPGDPQVTIPVPEELETVPGIPLNNREVDWYSREYPLETMNIFERASRDWANSIRDQDIEMREIRKEHDKLNKPLIMAARMSGEQEPTAEASGKDVTELVKSKARELGFLEAGITPYDHRYTYQSKKDWVQFPHAICLAYEQDFEPTQEIPSVSAEIVHIQYLPDRRCGGVGAGKVHQLAGLSGSGSQPQRQHRPLHPHVCSCWLRAVGCLRLPVDST